MTKKKLSSSFEASQKFLRQRHACWGTLQQNLAVTRHRAVPAPRHPIPHELLQPWHHQPHRGHPVGPHVAVAPSQNAAEHVHTPGRGHGGRVKKHRPREPHPGHSLPPQCGQLQPPHIVQCLLPRQSAGEIREALKISAAFLNSKF